MDFTHILCALLCEHLVQSVFHHRIAWLYTSVMRINFSLMGTQNLAHCKRLWRKVGGIKKRARYNSKSPRYHFEHILISICVMFMLTCARSEMHSYDAAAEYVPICAFMAFTVAFSMHLCTFMVLALCFQTYFQGICVLVHIFRKLKQVLWVLWYISVTGASFTLLRWTSKEFILDCVSRETHSMEGPAAAIELLHIIFSGDEFSDIKLRISSVILWTTLSTRKVGPDDSGGPFQPGMLWIYPPWGCFPHSPDANFHFISFPIHF